MRGTAGTALRLFAAYKCAAYEFAAYEFAAYKFAAYQMLQNASFIARFL